MKKFATFIAALSLCACSLLACGSDDDSKELGKVGDKCEVATDCESNNCNVQAGADADAPKVCLEAEKQLLEDGAECDAADACKSGKCGKAEGAADDAHDVCLADDASAGAQN